jgi:hypothetical protein
MFEKIFKISAKHREILRESCEEFERGSNFTRIFPAFGSHIYDQYFEQQKPNNKILYKYLYTKTDLSDLLGITHEILNEQEPRQKRAES